jgi:hypothetical protein
MVPRKAHTRLGRFRRQPHDEPPKPPPDYFGSSAERGIMLVYSGWIDSVGIDKSGSIW